MKLIRRYTGLTERDVAVDRYAVHYRDGWEGIGLDTDKPKLTRLVALAYARTDENGHARFLRGELMKKLDTNKQGVQKLIDRAVRDGWLTDLSCSECLVAPPFVSDKRYHAGPCPVHALMRELGSKKIKDDSKAAGQAI
ncbi:hypothetical protein A5656_03595 [Mycobacterium gordonae]|nr:hypothetical protein A5656_03595 [Mycobacterium gordonae]